MKRKLIIVLMMLDICLFAGCANASNKENVADVEQTETTDSENNENLDNKIEVDTAQEENDEESTVILGINDEFLNTLDNLIVVDKDYLYMGENEYVERYGEPDGYFLDAHPIMSYDIPCEKDGISRTCYITVMIKADKSIPMFNTYKNSYHIGLTADEYGISDQAINKYLSVEDYFDWYIPEEYSQQTYQEFVKDFGHEGLITDMSDSIEISWYLDVTHVLKLYFDPKTAVVEDGKVESMMETGIKTVGDREKKVPIKGEVISEDVSQKDISDLLFPIAMCNYEYIDEAGAGHNSRNEAGILLNTYYFAALNHFQHSDNKQYGTEGDNFTLNVSGEMMRMYGETVFSGLEELPEIGKKVLVKDLISYDSSEDLYTLMLGDPGAYKLIIDSMEPSDDKTKLKVHFSLEAGEEDDQLVQVAVGDAIIVLNNNELAKSLGYKYAIDYFLEMRSNN